MSLRKAVKNGKKGGGRRGQDGWEYDAENGGENRGGGKGKAHGIKKYHGRGR